MDQRTLRSTSSMGTPSSATASPNSNKSLLGRLTHSPNSSQLSSKTRAILAKLDELDTPARQVRRMPVLRRPAVERWVNPSPAKQSKREGAADGSLFALPVRRMPSAANSSTPDSPVFSSSTFNLTAPVLPLPQSSRSLDAPPLRRAADLVPSRLEILQQTLGTSTIRAKPYWRDLTRTPKQANSSLLPNGGGASSVDTNQPSISFANGNTSFNASKLCSLFDMDMGVKSVQRKTALPPPTRKFHPKPMKGAEPTQKKPTNVFSARFSEEDEDSNQGYDQEAYKKEMLSIKPLSALSEGTAVVDDRFKNLAFTFLKPRQNSAMEVLRTETVMETQHSSDESDDAEVEIVESREVKESMEEKQSEEGSEGCSSGESGEEDDEHGDESDAEKDKRKRNKQETSVSPITPADSSSTGAEASPISSKSVSPASPPTQSIQTQPPAIVSFTSDLPPAKQTNSDSTGLTSANANKGVAWDCEACFVSNNSDKENCVCCGASKPGPKKSAVAGASDDKPWDCQDCFVQNKADQSKCACCGASRPGSSSSASSQPAAPAPQRNLVSNIATFGASKQTSGSYSFGLSSGGMGTGASSAMPAAATASASVSANSAEPATSSATTAAPLFGIGAGTGTSSTTPIFGSGFGSKPATVTTTAATSNQVAPPVFGFGLSAPAVSKPSETSASSAPAVSSANPAAVPTQSLFGSGSSSGIFGSGLLGKPSGTVTVPTTTASSLTGSAPAPFTFGQPQLGTAGNKETTATTTASATAAPFTFGAKPAESTSSSAAPAITFGSIQPGTATASPFGSLASLSQAKPAPTVTTSGPAAASNSPFTFGAKPAGDTASSTAPAPVFGGFGAIKPLVSSSNSDSAANSVPASSPFSGFGLSASGSKASDPSATAASTAPSIPPFTGFGASFSKTPGITSTVSASASAPALFGFGGNAANNKQDAVSSTSTAVPTFAPFGSLAKSAAPPSSGNPFGGGSSLQPSSDLSSTFQFGAPQPSAGGLSNGTNSSAGSGLFVFGGGNSAQAVGGEQQQQASAINLFGAPSDSSAASFQLGGDSQFSNAFSYNSASSSDARRKIAVARRRKPGAR